MKKSFEKIRFEVERGHFEATLFPHLIDYVQKELELQGYSVHRVEGSQMDGAHLEVTW